LPSRCIYLLCSTALQHHKGDVIMSFARFMAGPIGRGVRVAVGLAPLLAGALNLCFIAPLLKAPFSGKAALQSK
jgi:hypothetical protein